MPGANDSSTDRSAIPESVVTTQGVSSWYSFDVTSAVQGWVSQDLPNNGLLLRASSASASGTLSFASANNAQADLRPRLIVTYAS